ncbi:MAG: hypothetical protein K6G09_02100, partial [Treponema sp.]|nr:hypothetical protein [Treponema sp.]
EIFKSKSNDQAVENFAKSFVSQAFKTKSFNKEKSKNYSKDIELLQQLFFFLLWSIAKQLPGYDESFFCDALSKDWASKETLSEILNMLARECCFNSNEKIQFPDFCTLKGIHFEQNESVLRLLHNFARSDINIKEGIINELNFVREQQISILPVWPNINKEDYSQSEAKTEIGRVQQNLEILNKLDSGFSDSEFKQGFMINTEDKKRTFRRPIKCKCFKESELVWKTLHQKGSKIIAYNEDKVFLKCSLKEKFLYLERNVITHVGENSGVYILFDKLYKKEKHLPQKLMLYSFYYAKKYLEEFKNETVAQDLLTILNYFFKKSVSQLGLTAKGNLLWTKIFDKDGDLRIMDSEIGKTNIFNILSETEYLYFKRFMGFLFCSENVTEDYITRNKTRIMVYLIYLSLELSKLDK